MKKALALIPCCLVMVTGVMGSLVGTSTQALAQRDTRNNGEIRWTIRLSGPVFHGLIPQGNADWRIRSDRKELKVEASNIGLPDGSLLVVRLNGTAIGSIRLALGRGQVELRSQDGVTPPNVKHSDVVTIWSGNAQVLSGTF